MMHIFGPVPWWEIALTLAGLALAVWCIWGYVRRRYIPREGSWAALLWLVLGGAFVAFVLSVSMIAAYLIRAAWQ